MHNGHIIALRQPGIAKEEGHLYSEVPYRGNGLEQAFKAALMDLPAQSINGIYSSMNGERFWSKEYGVAYLRNKLKFCEKVNIEHPADCYGDIGAATATTLIILAAHNLRKISGPHRNLVYSSSDFGEIGAIVVEKIHFDNALE